MNKNVMIVLAGGMMIALLVAFIVQASLGSKGPSSGGDRVEILVAAKDLPIGKELASSDMKWRDWPEKTIFKGAIVREEGQQPLDVLSGRLRRDVAKGEPVLRSVVASESKGNPLAATLGTGMRAVAIKVSAASMVGGFLMPGDMVDVVVTHEVKAMGRNKEIVAQAVSRDASETIIQNIKVMAVDQKARRDDDDAKVGRTITLEVTPEQAETLVLAGAMGEISLALRGAGDTTIRDVSHGLTTDVKISAVLAQVAKLQRKTSIKTNIVRLYGRDEVQNVVVHP